MTRDSKWLWVGMLLPIIVEVFNALVANPADYGIPPGWLPGIRIATLIVGLASGKLATSPLPSAATKRLMGLLLVLALVLPATGCALNGTPRHQTTVAAVTISDSLIAAADLERAHWQNIGLAEATHRQFQGQMVKVLTAAKAVDETILAWPKDSPTPANLTPLVLALKADLDVGLALLPASPTKDLITTKLASVWILVGLVLGGGA